MEETALASQIEGVFNEMTQDLAAFRSKVQEIEQELNEHNLVIETMGPMDAGRKAFRLVGGVLVERTVGEVLPAVKRNKEGIEQVLLQMRKELERKQQDLDAFQKKYKIRVQGGPQASGAGGKKSQGVLV